MLVTTEWMQDHFTRYNKRYFNGKLPVPRLLVSSTRTRLGTMTYKCRYGAGRPLLYDFTIRLTNYYNLSEDEYADVLIHEMIHLYIAVNGIKDTSIHGIHFRKMMAEINADGHNVTVMKHVSETARNDTEQSRKVVARHTNYVVLAIETNKGRFMLSVVNPSYILPINNSLRHAQTVKSYAWYVSDNPYFATFTRVRTPRGRLVTAEVYNDMTARMRPLDVSNGRIGEPKAAGK